MSSMQTSGAPVPVLPVGDAGAGAKKTETEQAGTTETAKPLSTETSTGEPAKTTDEPAKETSASGTAGASSGASSSDADADANPFKAGGSGPALIAGLPIPLPEGWISEYDEESKQWFFVNEKTDPPTVTWDDPRKGEMKQLVEQLKDPNLGTEENIAAKEAEEKAKAEAAAKAAAEAEAAAKAAQEAIDAAKTAEDHRRLAEEAQKAADIKAAADRQAKLEASREAARKQAEDAAVAAAAAAEAAKKAQQAQAEAEEALRRNKAAADAAARAAELERMAAEARKQAEQVQDAALDPTKPLPVPGVPSGSSGSANVGPGGVPFPHDGWLAQLDPRSGRYYFIDRSKNPPLITWDDPRTPEIETAPVMPKQAAAPAPAPAPATAPAPAAPVQRQAVCTRGHPMQFLGINTYYGCDSCGQRRDMVGEIHARCQSCNQDFCPNCCPVPASAFYNTQRTVIAPPPPAPPTNYYSAPSQPPPKQSSSGMSGSDMAMGALAGSALLMMMASNNNRRPPPPYHGGHHGGGGYGRPPPGVHPNPRPPNRW